MTPFELAHILKENGYQEIPVIDIDNSKMIHCYYKEKPSYLVAHAAITISVFQIPKPKPLGGNFVYYADMVIIAESKNKQ